MKKPSATYRFFWAFTALTVLLSMSVPAGLHAGGLAGLCDTDMANHDMPSMPEADHCDLAAHHGSEHDGVDTDTSADEEDCPLNFTCTCSIDEATAKTHAIPALSKISVDYSPVIVQILDFSSDTPTVGPSEQIFASLYSPPIFLKNSSFLN